MPTKRYDCRDKKPGGSLTGFASWWPGLEVAETGMEMHSSSDLDAIFTGDRH